jgi:uncharacterized cupredoxin-like copper-binding protein
MRRLHLLCLMMALSVLLGACGPSGPSTNINVVFTEFRFMPDQFTIPAGQEITIKATNNGAVEHEFVIMNWGTSAGDEFDAGDEANIYWEIELGPGESKTETFTAPTQPGDYELVCGIQGHMPAGMVGKLTVVE